MLKMQINLKQKDLETKIESQQGKETEFTNFKCEPEHFLILFQIDIWPSEWKRDYDWHVIVSNSLAHTSDVQSVY